MCGCVWEKKGLTCYHEEWIDMLSIPEGIDMLSCYKMHLGAGDLP